MPYQIMDLRVGILVLLVSLEVSGQDVVNTTSGLVRGEHKELEGVMLFLGIPYAEAPEGDLRFKPPVRKARMEGIYNATSNAKVCPQPSSVGSESWILTEDCLRLDIYVPVKRSQGNETAKFPVMIWIHGGGYLLGTSNQYPSGAIATTGQVIVVAVNYRLGLLGFLNTMDENSVGNFGLRDQCSAIEWVAENIGEFGGDVTRVTIFGESAGSSSTMQLAMSNLCEGKFQRVIAQSGSPASPWSYNRNPKGSSLKLAKTGACPSDSLGLVKCLRNKTVDELLGFQADSVSLYTPTNDWVPSYTTDIFPDNPLDILTGKASEGLRRFRSIDFISGVCNEEGELSFVYEVSRGKNFINPTINDTDGILSSSTLKTSFYDVISGYQGLNSDEMDRLYPAFKFQYTDWKEQPDEYSNVRSLIRLNSDVSMNIGIVAFANVHSFGLNATNHSAARGSTYFYQLKPIPSILPTYPWSQGSTHTHDVYFVFGFLLSTGTPAEAQLSTKIIHYWTNFAKTGSPNGLGVAMPEPMWPSYSKEAGAYIELDLNMNNDSISTFPYARRIAFWEEFYKPELERIRHNKKEADKNKCKDKDKRKETNSAHAVSSFWCGELFLAVAMFKLKFVWEY